MKKTNKALASVSLLLLSTAMAFGFEYGGLADNNSKFAGNLLEDSDSVKLNQKNSVSAWLRTPFDESGKNYFSAEVKYQYENDFRTETVKNLIDLNLFKFKFEKETGENNISISAGRFFYSDATNLILTQNIDGLSLEYSTRQFGLQLFGGYTGLLNSKAVSILDNEADETDKDALYDFAAKYICGGAAFSVKNIFSNHTLDFQALAVIKAEGTSYNRFYGTAAASGPLTEKTYYTLSSSAGMYSSNEEDYKLSNLSKLSLSYYSDYKSASISLNGIYASGKQGPFEAFKGFTSQTAVETADSLEYESLVKAGLSQTIKPSQKLLLSASEDMIFNAAEKIEYQGFAAGISLNWQILTDVNLGAGYSQYLDKESNENNYSVIKIKAAISF